MSACVSGIDVENVQPGANGIRYMAEWGGGGGGQ